MNTLASFLNVHQGESILVCGCGHSLNQLEDPEEFVTIGVNDVGRKFHPDYLVVVNPPHQFAGDRFRYVGGSQAKFIFTQLDLGLAKGNVVKFSLGTPGGTDFSNPEVLNYTQNSPYVALCLAIHMGARRIGLLGVDFTNDHFFGPTGVHSLTSQLPVIDQQYRRLNDAARAHGVEIYNLSETSRLTAFPKLTQTEFNKRDSGGKPLFLTCSSVEKTSPLTTLEKNKSGRGACPRSPRVFVINYNFLTCGDVFGTGLSNAAKQMGLEHELALWDDPYLGARIDRFQPDLIFVVHGRRFAEKWKGKFNSYNTAVWLVDEPYEVDDTARWSSTFDTVFINDANTLTRHPNAHYLPVCFDPLTHCDPGANRSQAVGFIGGYNETRNQYLDEMAKAGMLSYVVGGPWKSRTVQQLSIGPKLSPQKTTALYQDTSVVLNVFRDIHHFNCDHVPARSMNPRIYEALACGALVVSEEREEISEVFPELPTFSDSRSLITTLEALLANESTTRTLLQQNRARLQGHTYADRLAKVLQVCLGWQKESRTNIVADVQPFTATPKRNLLYHVWPVKGTMWKWNLDQLLKRVDLFNGRRVMSIVHDERSDTPDEVQEVVDGHGFEFVIARNDERGEAINFAQMMEMVASRDVNELTFYGHAKGVKYEPHIPQPVRRWSEVQYQVVLDNWLAIREQLQRYAMTGPFKRYGRFKPHRNLADWHYSGTFFWMRHAHVFTRDYQNVPQFYGGVETWPGTVFSRDETGCVFIDDLGPSHINHPYFPEFWRTAEPALKRWQASLKPCPPPQDLVTPRPFRENTPHLMEQKPEEFEWLLDLLLKENVDRLLVVGSRSSGLEWHLAQQFFANQRQIEITTIKRESDPGVVEVFRDAEERFRQRIILMLTTDSLTSVRAQLAPQYTAVFLDGDRGYKGCRADFELALTLNPRLIALHDIVDSDWHASVRCCVSRVWNELKGQYRTVEKSSDEWAGIGVVML